MRKIIWRLIAFAAAAAVLASAMPAALAEGGDREENAIPPQGSVDFWSDNMLGGRHNANMAEFGSAADGWASAFEDKGGLWQSQMQDSISGSMDSYMTGRDRGSWDERFADWNGGLPGVPEGWGRMYDGWLDGGGDASRMGAASRDGAWLAQAANMWDLSSFDSHGNWSGDWFDGQRGGWSESWDAATLDVHWGADFFADRQAGWQAGHGTAGPPAVGPQASMPSSTAPASVAAQAAGWAQTFAGYRNADLSSLQNPFPDRTQQGALESRNPAPRSIIMSSREAWDEFRKDAIAEYNGGTGSGSPGNVVSKEETEAAMRAARRVGLLENEDGTETTLGRMWNARAQPITDLFSRQWYWDLEAALDYSSGTWVEGAGSIISSWEGFLKGIELTAEYIWQADVNAADILTYGQLSRLTGLETNHGLFNKDSNTLFDTIVDIVFAPQIRAVNDLVNVADLYGKAFGGGADPWLEGAGMIINPNQWGNIGKIVGDIGWNTLKHGVNWLTFGLVNL